MVESGKRDSLAFAPSGSRDKYWSNILTWHLLRLDSFPYCWITLFCLLSIYTKPIFTVQSQILYRSSIQYVYHPPKLFLLQIEIFSNSATPQAQVLPLQKTAYNRPSKVSKSIIILFHYAYFSFTHITGVTFAAVPIPLEYTFLKVKDPLKICYSLPPNILQKFWVPTHYSLV